MKKFLLSHLLLLASALTAMAAGHTVSISSQTNVYCNGMCNGSATASVSGGVGPFSYSWNTSPAQTTATASNLCAGTYMVTVTDQSDSTIATKSVTITEPSLLSVSVTASPSTPCAGDTITVTATASGGIAPYTYSWNSGGTLSTKMVFPPDSLTCTATITDANGCTQTGSKFITVNAAPSPTISGPTNICAGTSATLTASGGTTYNWSTGAVTAAITVTPSSSTNYTVTATNASGCSKLATHSITVNVPPTASITGNLNICTGTSTVLTATGGTAYSWNTGAVTASITVLPDSSKNYSVIVTTAAGCTASAAVFVSLTPSTNLYGHVNYSGGNLTNGNIVLFRYLPSQTNFDTVQTFPLSGTGDFQFTSVVAGTYLIKVFADTALYPNALPTYYGDQSLWDASPSSIISHDCTAHDTLQDITLIEIPFLATGPGKIGGNIIKGPGFGKSTKITGYSPERSDPIPGVDVKLGKNPGGSSNIVAITRTDGTGDYAFNSLPLNAAGESYVVFVDIPGLARDSSFVVSLTPTDSVFTGLDYVADSTTIRYVPVSTVGIKKVNVAAANKFNVYPNPSNGDATVHYQINANAVVSIAIYTVLGVNVYELVNNDQQAGTYNYTISTKKNNLSPGVYFISLTIDGKTSIQRLVLTE